MPRHKPDPRDEAYSPNGPIIVSSGSSPAAAMTTASMTMKAFPKPKPALAMASGPFPRAKPASSTAAVAAAAPAVQAAPPPPVAAVPAAPAMATAPTAPVPAAAPASAPESSSAGTCGDACNEVIFRSIGNCLYVQNANPHSVTFIAHTNTRTITLALAGADAGKADAHKPFEAKEGTPSAIGEDAYHTRISDPFSPSAPGIAVYRARLGSADACVKTREEITSYSASFARTSAAK
jgi:hypothetical protein